MMVMSESNSFRTSDTALAAFLISEGFTLSDIDHTSKRSFYLFPNDSEKLNKTIGEYDTARVTGNIVLFFNAYQSLLRRVKERY